MTISQTINLIEIDELVNKFLREHQTGIKTIHQMYYHDNNKLSLQAFISELMNELRTGCVTFFNKNFSMEDVSLYLFYIVNAFAKKNYVPKIKYTTRYLCPGCLFLGNEVVMEYINEIFKCECCEKNLKKSTDPKEITLFRSFFRHKKRGYHCQDCDKFIPHSLDDLSEISCPYYDCCFVGPWNKLKKMHHPSINGNLEKSIVDYNKDNIQVFSDNKIDAQFQLEMKEELEHKINLLRGIIDVQYNSVPYTSTDFTAKHKMLCYKSFDNILNQYPGEMVEYLLNYSRSGGFQHKIFQEYIRLLEEAIPFTFKKNRKYYRVRSLLDDNLFLFDGISSFNAVVNNKGIIKNGTTEVYIGGRKSQIIKPFYIGKLLNIIDKKTKKSLIDHVLEYSFSLIKTHDIVPETEIVVTHLRIAPHYQMGGMAYVNRVRKKIIDRARLFEKGIK